MAAITQATAVPVGDARQFGPYGPQYEVLGPAASRDGKPMARIVMLHGGEELDYPLEDILNDPEAL